MLSRRALLGLGLRLALGSAAFRPAALVARWREPVAAEPAPLEPADDRPNLIVARVLEPLLLQPRRGVTTRYWGEVLGERRTWSSDVVLGGDLLLALGGRRLPIGARVLAWRDEQGVYQVAQVGEEIRRPAALLPVACR